MAEKGAELLAKVCYFNDGYRLNQIFKRGSMAAQLADVIIMEGEKMDLYSNPLEVYWTKRNKKRPKFHKSESCWRGYVATWEIRDKQLFLTDIDASVEKRFSFFGGKSVKCTLKTIFSKPGRDGIKAVWFSGKLRIPRGKMTQYEHSGYDSRFEREKIITIDQGNVIKIITLDYTQRTLVVS